MIEAALFVGAFVLAAVASVWLAVVLRRNRRARSATIERLNERLAETHDTRSSHLERPPSVVRLVRLNEPPATGENRGQTERAAEKATVADEPTGREATSVVPVIQVELGSTEPPGTELAFDFVASVLEAVHPELAGAVPVRHYDVQFRFGPDGLLVSRNCFRVAVTPALADRLLTEETYRTHDLRRDVKAADDGDEETAPVLWGECRSY